MRLRQWMETLVSHPHIGIPVAALLALLPIPHWLGIVLGLVIVLRTGGFISYAGFAVVLAAAYASEQRYSLQGVSETIGPFLTLFVPMALMAIVLRITRHLTVALESGAYVLVGVIGAAYVMTGLPSLEATEAFFQCRRQLLGGYTEVDALASMTHLSVQQATLYLMLVWPALFYAFQVVMVLLARYVQAWLFYPGGFKKDFLALRLSRVSAVLFGFLFVVGNFLPVGKEVILDGSEYVIIFQLSAVALGLLVFAGLGMVHWYFKYKRIGGWAVGLLYLSIMVVGPLVLPALAVLALVDTGVDLRRRMGGGV